MKATITHGTFSVKSLIFIPFRSIAIYYWHFVISHCDKQNFSVCYCTVLPLGNIGKYFAIIKWKVIFPILQILKHNNADYNDTQHNNTDYNDTQHNNTDYNGTQHNDTEHNDTQHKGLICDFQHKWHPAQKTLSIPILCRYTQWHYAECHILFIVMLSVVMLNAVMLVVVVPFNKLYYTHIMTLSIMRNFYELYNKTSFLVQIKFITED